MTELDSVHGTASVAVPSRDYGPGQPAPVTLIQFPPIWGRNVSPFGLKLESWLKLADIPYEVRTSTSLRKAPKGKLPYIFDEGRAIGDSTLIIEHLKASRGIDPDAGLSAREVAEATALQRMFEDHLYFAIAYSRWIDEEGWPLVSDAFFGNVRQPLRRMGQTYYRERVRRMLHTQGMGRHSQEEIYALARADLEAAAAYLGDKPFFMGERITSIDAVAFGVLANIILVPLDTELKRIALALPPLASWCEAMEQGLGDGI
jgi:glutathione S-transferase